MDTIQRQSIDQNLLKLAETSGFSDLWAQDYSGYFEDIKDYIYIYLNGEKYRPQDISPINIFSFVTLKNEILAFPGWPYYILERLTLLYAMFNFLGFFSLSTKRNLQYMRNTRQNNHYEVGLLGKSTFKPIPYSSWIKNNTQQKPYKQKPYKTDLFPSIENENLTENLNLSGP